MSNSVIRLQSGVYFDVLDPDPEKILLADISGSLSKICRFGGHGFQFYSVAEHSVNCAIQARLYCLSPEETLAVLFHDAAEAYLGDVVRPLKAQLARYHEIEASVQAAIAKRFQIDFDSCHNKIKQIDNDLLIFERDHLFPPEVEYVWEAEATAKKFIHTLSFWDPIDAEYHFRFAAKRLLHPDLIDSHSRNLHVSFRNNVPVAYRSQPVQGSQG